MTQFAANLTMLFNEVPFMERFKKAADSGFKGVEFLFPYAYSAADIKRELDQNQLKLVLHNLPAGDWDAGERGVACLPDRIEEFREGVKKAIEYATALGVKQINCLAGKAPSEIDPKLLHDTFVANLKFAADELKKVNIRLLIEPINTFDIPGFFLSKTQHAIQILSDVDSDNLFIQYDIYHAQRMEGELSKTIENNLAKIAHIQLADNPGRNEPGTGEINYAYLFKLLDDLGYEGWVGCEYKPATNTEAGLGWISTY
ncbi:hydroxypyruvate isomerase [Polynucleobacter sp. AP-Melu-500A-A1]|uniref:hydroxypyruvate isomerase n=1 Tax=Polynucleobacter sp. AP-Melu-500A-A1 TaxID=2576929 RepID=UPI001C0DB157|nr:hydroxypyruvate isomerase [Polynucleobacter sp. AP-Melu-500A-A1]MBU3630253.1 hydroxypyruvate isomerase [Polynucleobacter sp. AP-Melu-500A-A1]